MQFALNEIIESFEYQSNITCEVILGSSGKLCNQILAGAPFDVFLSADIKYPKLLDDQGFIVGDISTYAYGNLILWTLYPDLKPDWNTLTSSSIKHIAIPNPETAPYGIAALETLENLKIKDAVQEKLVFGESVSQTNQYITSKAAQIGITSKAIIHATPWSTQGNWNQIPNHLHTPVAQGSVVLKNRPSKQLQATQFQNFLKSDAAVQILSKFGYTIAKDE